MTNKKLKRGIAMALSTAIATAMVTTAVPTEWGIVAEAANKGQIKEAIDKLALELTKEEMEHDGEKVIKVSVILKTNLSALQAYGIQLDYDDKKLKPIEILDEYGLLDEDYYKYNSSNGALKSSPTSNYADNAVNVQYADAQNPILKNEIPLFIAFFKVLDGTFGTTDISIMKDNLTLTGSTAVWKGEGDPDDNGDQWEAANKAIALAEDESKLTVTYDTGIAAATVKFDANGGQINGEESVSVEAAEGSQVELPVAPVKGDKIFLGWSTDKTAAEGIKTGTVKAENTTYYAIWGKSQLPESVTAKVTGTTVYGGTLKAEAENVPEDAGTASYQWYRNDALIEGAAGESYTLVKEDIGKEISAAISYEEYTGEVRAKADGLVAKAAAEAAPAITAADCEAESEQITVKKIEGALYSINDGEFTENNVFTGLNPLTEYKISVKYAETETNLASEPVTFAVTTAKPAPKAEGVITASGIYGTALADMKPVGKMVYEGAEVAGEFEWKVEDANKIYPKAGESVYQAVFKPKNTEAFVSSVKIDVKVTCEAKKITVTAASISTTYGAVVPAFDFEVSENDLVAGDNKDALALTLKTDALENPDAGEYAITKKECGNSNYDVTVKDGILKVAKAKPEITITNTKETEGSVTGAKASLTPESADAEVVIEYKTTDSDAWTTTIPTAVGTYTVRAYLPEEKAGKNLTAITSGEAITADYVIEKASSSDNEGGNTQPGGSGNGGGGASGGSSGGGSASGGSGIVILPPVDNTPSQDTDKDATTPDKDAEATEETTKQPENTDEKDNAADDKNNNDGAASGNDSEKENNNNSSENSSSKDKDKDSDKSTKAKNVKLNKKKATVKVGKTIKLKVLNTKKKITWSSNKPKIAKVNKNGKVTTLKPGKAVIKAKIKNGKTLKFTITVKKVSKKKK